MSILWGSTVYDISHHLGQFIVLSGRYSNLLCTCTVTRHGDSTRWQGMKQDLCPNWYQPLQKKKIRAVEELWGWTYSFCFYLRRRECLTICRCHNKGSTFSSVFLRPWVLVWPGFERLPNWANWVAVWNATHLETFMLVYNFNFTVIPFWLLHLFHWLHHF